MSSKGDREHTAPKMGTFAPIVGATSAALFSKTRRLLLALFFGHPEVSYHMRQAAKWVDSGQGAVQRELRNLAGAGLLTRTTRGRQVYYQANQGHPVYPELRALVLKTVGLGDVLRSALQPLAARIGAAFVYGSVARYAAAAASDVDVMVIGQVTFAEVVAALRPTQETLGREVNPSVYPRDEFARRVAAADHFMTTVLRGPKVFLIGDDHELERLAQAGMAESAPD